MTITDGVIAVQPIVRVSGVTVEIDPEDVRPDADVAAMTEAVGAKLGEVADIITAAMVHPGGSVTVKSSPEPGVTFIFTKTLSVEG
jgi:hypothetical protein